MAIIDGVLVLPVWVGPIKLLALSRAYTFGLFAASSETLAFASDDFTWTLAKREVTIRWPWHLLGTCCWLAAPNGKCEIIFGLPYGSGSFPVDDLDASVARSVSAIAEMLDLPSDSYDRLVEAGIWDDIVMAVEGLQDIKSVNVIRRIGKQAKAVLLNHR
jgi:hypothetical protein